MHASQSTVYCKHTLLFFLESGIWDLQSVIPAMARDQVHCVPEYCVGERLREYAFVRVISQIPGPISVRKHIGVSLW